MAIKHHSSLNTHHSWMKTHHQSLINRQTVIMNHHANSILLNNTFVFWCWKLRSTSSLSLDEQKISSEVRSLAQFYQLFSLGFVQRPPKLQLLALCTMVDLCCCLICCCFCFVFMPIQRYLHRQQRRKSCWVSRYLWRVSFFWIPCFFLCTVDDLTPGRSYSRLICHFFDSCKGRKEKKHFHVWAKTILEVFF